MAATRGRKPKVNGEQPPRNTCRQITSMTLTPATRQMLDELVEAKVGPSRSFCVERAVDMFYAETIAKAR